MVQAVPMALVETMLVEVETEAGHLVQETLVEQGVLAQDLKLIKDREIQAQEVHQQQRECLIQDNLLQVLAEIYLQI